MLGARWWLAGLMLVMWAVQAAAADPDWGAWMRERREAAYRDTPAELARLAQAELAARAAGDDLTWGLVAGYRLILLSGVSDATAEALAVEVAAALEHKPALAAPSAARLSLWLGLARNRQDNRDMPGLAKALDSAQVVADQLGQPAMKAEVDAARAVFRVYETDATGAESLAQRALAASRDPFLKLEIFLGPQVIARILSLQTADTAQRLLADIDARLAELDTNAYPYMAMNLGAMKAIVLRRILQPAAAQQELNRWLAFAEAHPGMVLSASVRGLQGGLHRDLKDWQGCIAALTPLTAATYQLTTRVNNLIALATCQAQAKSPGVFESLAALDHAMPSLEGSPAMVEAVLGGQAQAYEALGDLPKALDKLKAQRRATVARYAKANEAARQQVETAYQVAAKEKENTELKAREALSEQRRLVLGGALIVALGVLAIVAELLRRQAAQRKRLAELAEELKSVNDQLRDLNASRTRLVAAACHDLRQPAHALGMLAEIASEKAEGEGRRTLEAIRRSSASLSDLLDALFDLSRLESDRYVPSVSAVSLGELLDDLQTQFTVAALSKGLSLRVDAVQASVLSDAHLLRRMLMNLLSNAIKYTERGEVHISAEREGDEWVVAVSDTGRGIAPEQQAAAFSEYVRLDSSRGTDGLGIGLALVRRSATLLGHALEMVSEVGQGSRFTLRLPAVHARPVVHDEASEPGGSGQLIAVVDDDDHIRQAMCELLRLRGYRAVAAASLDGLARQLMQAGAVRPDLLLSDFHLATGDSLDDVAQLIGEHGRWAGVPAVLITGDLSADVLARCESLGITVAYKPLPARKLVRLIHRLLSEAPGKASASLQSRR